MTSEQQEIARLKARIEHLESWLQGILDYESTEVAKDEFAYDRLMDVMKDAAREALQG